MTGQRHPTRVGSLGSRARGNELPKQRAEGHTQSSQVIPKGIKKANAEHGSHRRKPKVKPKGRPKLINAECYSRGTE